MFLRRLHDQIVLVVSGGQASKEWMVVRTVVVKGAESRSKCEQMVQIECKVGGGWLGCEDRADSVAMLRVYNARSVSFEGVYKATAGSNEVVKEWTATTLNREKTLLGLSQVVCRTKKSWGVRSVGDLEGFESGVWDVVRLDVGRRGAGSWETTETQLVSFHLPTHLAALTFNLPKESPLIRLQIIIMTAPNLPCMSEGKLMKSCLMVMLFYDYAATYYYYALS